MEFILVVVLNSGSAQFFRTTDCFRIKEEVEGLKSVQSGTCIPVFTAKGELI
jgi:hypothetical protein